MTTLKKYCADKINRTALLVLFFISIGALSASAQTYFHYYENFNISGTNSICPDNTTVYTYSSPYYVTWSVSGGTIVGSNVGYSINVKWSSSGSLSATGEEQNCWYDPEIWPPTEYCNVFHYTSYEFNVSDQLINYYFTSNASYCSGTSGASLSLNSSQSGVNYQLKFGGSNVGSAISGTGGSIAWSNLTSAGTYNVVATKTSTGCSRQLPSSATVSILPASVGGSISGGLTACGSASGSVTLSGHTGTIHQWEQNSGGGWIGMGTASNPLSYSVTTTTTFRAWVISAGCSGIYSSTATITIDPNSVGGSVSGGGTYCSSASGSLNLSGNTGNVVRWEQNTGGGWSTISGTSGLTSYSYSATTSTTYRAIVQNGVCGEVASSSATVTINPASVGGTISGSTTHCVSGSGSLNLSGHNGSVVRWEKNSGGGWTNESNTTATLSYSSISATTQYRALIASGVCSSVYSAIATITISATSVGGNIGGSNTVCASASGQLTLTGNVGSVVRWEKNTGGSWSTIAETSTTHNYSAVTTTTNYRAVVKNGACTEVYSTTATITIDPVTNPGTLAANTFAYGNSATGNLSLTGYNGFIVRWEKNTGSSWTNIAHNTASYSYNISQSTSFRVVSQSGVCTQGTSNEVSVTLYPAPTVTPSNPGTITYGTSVQLSSPNTYHQYQWYLNGSPISGATGQTVIASQPGDYFVQVKGSAAAPTSNSPSVKVKGLASGYDQSLNSVAITSVLKENVAESASLYSLTTSEVSQAVSYQDGLGRTFQTIGVGQSPSGGDMVVQAAASRYGIMDTTFLPYTTTTRDGHYRPNAIRGSTSYTSYSTSEQYLFYQGTAKVATDSYPFARTEFTNDPTFRVTKQGAPGQDWQLTSGHAVQRQEALNNSSTYRVRYWNAAGQTTANYADNSVMVTITTDENGHKVQTYVDARGLKVLKQVQLNETLEGVLTDWLETYYIYDEYGRLKYIVPPKAMKVLGTGSSLNATHADVAELIYWFVYDPKGRLVEKKVPGAGVQYIVYDQLDRVVLTQDGTLRPTNRWAFVKYDKYNRVVYSGLYKNDSQTTRLGVQQLLNDNPNPWFETEGTAVHGYTNLAWPTTGTVANSIFTVNYYDHYNFDRSGGDDFTYDNAHLSGQESTRLTATRGMPTGSKKNVLDAIGSTTSYWITAAIFYDKFDRPIQVQTNNHLHTGFIPATLDKYTVIYDFVKATKSKTTHYQNASTVVNLIDRNEFDNSGRVIKTYRKINSDAEQLLVQYEYNALGQVVDKKLHNTGGSSFLQSVDYRYNIRGWLISINNSQLNVNATNNDETGDFFGMELIYNVAESGLSNTQYYNGNISAIKWKGQGTTGAIDQRSYKYGYDKSDRLKTATFQAYNGTSWTKEAGTLNESITYDHNGNILTLSRQRDLRGNSGTTVTSTPETIDNLTYTYETTCKSNRLVKVEDAASVIAGFINVNQTTEYTYDQAGSTVSDVNKGITGITYNLLGKPQVINFSSGKKVEYIYDAAGTKLTMKTYQGATVLTTTNYSGGFVYEGSSPVLSFFSSAEGRVVKNGSSFDYQYAIADHQGNTRVVFSSGASTSQTLTATFEGDANDNSNLFTNVSNVVTFGSANTTPGGTKVVRMNQTYKVGPSKSLKVYPGDQINLEVRGYHESSSGYSNTSQSLATMISAVAGAFGGVSGGGGESGSIFSGVNSAFGAYGLGGSTDNQPAAYLNYILFDQNYKMLTMGWTRVPATPLVKHTLTLAGINIKEPGYIFAYLSYESLSNNFVYFDDMKIIHTRSKVVQYNEYYPFGQQTANSWTRENTTGNQFLANGGTELNSTSSLYDLAFRNYDPVLGRMNGVDPMATKYASLTPYNFSFNDPVTFTDPSGADPWDEFRDEMNALQNWFNNTMPVPMDPGGGGSSGSAYYNSMMGGYGVAGAGLFREFGVSMSFGSLPYSVVGRAHEQQMRQDAQSMDTERYANKYGTTYVYKPGKRVVVGYEQKLIGEAGPFLVPIYGQTEGKWVSNKRSQQQLRLQGVPSPEELSKRFGASFREWAEPVFNKYNGKSFQLSDLLDDLRSFDSSNLRDDGLPDVPNSKFQYTLRTIWGRLDVLTPGENRTTISQEYFFDNKQYMPTYMGTVINPGIGVMTLENASMPGRLIVWGIKLEITINF